MTFRASVERYLGAVAQQYHRGDAREESYYDVLKQLWEELGSQLSSAHATLTVLPRQTEAGNPDMRVWSGQQHVTGYIEAKEPGITNLDHVEVSEQLKRYRAAFPNVILTNFLEFRLYRFGQPMGQPVTIGSLQALQAGMRVPLQHEDQFRELVERFFDFQLPRAYTAQTLAIALADRTRYLQQQVLAQLLDDEDHKLNSELVNLMAEFKQVLMSDLTSDTFADLYAQTITYGLFAARMRVTGTFTRQTAIDGIPATIGILRRLFKYISIGDTPERLRVIIDDIADVLAVADTDTVFKGFDKNGRDPVADFYETFLGEYDPAKKKQHGVYYTPQPVVSYIVRSIDTILRDSFGKSDGLADPSVTVLDPAAGTMTFPATAVRLAAETYKAKYGDGSLDSWIKGHVLRDFYAFELMMAPYAIGHLRMGTLLTELGYTMSSDDRFKLYLTNTLDVSTAEQNPIPGLSPLADESHMAEAVKTTQPVLVIMGNPPYARASDNKGDWIVKLIGDYAKTYGKSLGERNLRALHDDYVKFIRFAQWKIDEAGEGVLGFITNNSYLDNVTARGMRQSLMTSFDQLHILNLHGNSLRKEKSPDGSKDENVFDIMQGVAIILAVKRNGVPKGIWYSDLWGDRDAKYATLGDGQMMQTSWKELTPDDKLSLFVPRNTLHLDEYEEWPKVTEIFPVSRYGIITARDRLAIQWSREEAWQTINRFVNMPPEEAREVFHLGKDARDWKVPLAQEDVRASGPSQDKVVPILYRPFDVRFTYYTGHARGFHAWPVHEAMQHMLAGPNTALITSRMTKGEDFHHVQVTEHIAEVICMSPKTSNNGFVFPLYVYGVAGDSHSEMLASDAERPVLRQPNINSRLMTELTERFGTAITPENIFAYVYAVLESPTYAQRYAEFLKTDFPRIPFTKDRDIFLKLAELGQQLINLHLMRSPELDNPISRFCGKGDGTVVKVEYDVDRGRVSINPTQYFDGVAPDLWSYQVGGYQVLAKWLKDRKGRYLTSADSIHYSRVVTALSKTVVVQSQIDLVVNASGLFVLQ
ncbi:MAG: N-6 DNA methylase [Caldiserica bacterium]|nr:N-6 DNA methylase [Caldisericota bacterium]